VCDPFARLEYAFGEPHAAQASASSLHSNVASASVAENSNDAALDVVLPIGPLTIEVSGGAVLTVQVLVAGDPSTFPSESLARTANVCVPSPRPE
jgi:hypothetical protein